MRALFVTSPGLGHVFPTVPLAHALRAAGHEVRYATGGVSLAVAEAGMNVVDVTPGLDYLPLYMPADDDGDNPMFAQDPEDELLAKLFGRVSGAMVDGVLAAARSWHPDVLIAAPLQGAGLLAATALGLPYVELPLGSYDSGKSLSTMVRDAMTAHYERHGVTGQPPKTIRLTSILPSLAALLPQDKQAKDALPMRYVPYNGTRVLPDWLTHPPERPRIAVTLGSIEAQFGGITMLAPLMVAAGDVDAEFVLTLGGGDVSLLGPLPGNVRVVDWVPLDALLETCAAVIHHGGTGTMLTAVAAGIPQCVVPRGSYQQTAGEAVPGRGIGITADSATLGAAECQTLLRDETMRDAALDARAELMAMPAPAELVPRLVEFAGHRGLFDNSADIQRGVIQHGGRQRPQGAGEPDRRNRAALS